MQSVCLVNRYGASGSTWNSSSLVHSEDGVAKGGGMLRGYMYRTMHRNGICRITLFSNVSWSLVTACKRCWVNPRALISSPSQLAHT